jgi:3',5'-cyclic AMP phosphodiesterase CpdA
MAGGQPLLRAVTSPDRIQQDDQMSSLRHRVLHLSDTHVSATGFDQFGVDALSSLDRVLRDVRHVPDLDLVVVSGDVSDDGSAEGGLAVRERVAAFARPRRIPQVYCMGNHDQRAAFGSVFHSGHLNSDGQDIGSEWDGGPERAAVSMINGLRVITLDSVVPGEVYGHLDRKQLVWLRSVLAEPAPAGSMVVLHHPPVASQDSLFLSRAALDEPAALESALRGSDVRIVLCGHFHTHEFGTIAEKPVWVTPAVIWQIDRASRADLVRGISGAGASVIDVGGPGSPRCHVVCSRSPESGKVLFAVDAVTLQRLDQWPTRTNAMPSR